MILSGWESVFFWIFSIAAILAGLLTVMARNAVHSALFLISSLVSVAALFILLGAEFIAGVQILVYVGGVMVLFLFVIMLVNVKEEEKESTRIFTRQYIPAVVLVFLLGGTFLFSMSKLRNDTDFITKADSVAASQPLSGSPAVEAGKQSRN